MNLNKCTCGSEAELKVTVGGPNFYYAIHCKSCNRNSRCSGNLLPMIYSTDIPNRPQGSSDEAQKVWNEMNDHTIVIAGITRSGLSLTMQMLESGGIDCVGEWPAYEKYSMGGIQWEAIKGRAVKVVDTHRQLPPKGKYKVIRLHRSIVEQSKSIIRFMDQIGGVTVPMSNCKKIANSLLADYAIIDQWASKQDSVIRLRFEDLITKKEQVAKRLDVFLGGGLDTLKMQGVVIDRGVESQEELLEIKMLWSQAK